MARIVQKETVLVTRIFDQRVKSFIKNVLMDQGVDGMQLKYYLYRVEFQARLAPHIHGCAWMKKEEIKPYQVDDTFEYDNTKLPTLIDKFVSCELPDDKSLRQTVEERELFGRQRLVEQVQRPPHPADGGWQVPGASVD